MPSIWATHKERIAAVETCNCHMMVFRIEIEPTTFKATPEVAEAKPFKIDDVAQAIRDRRGLAGSDGYERNFTDNFAAVFARFMSPERGREFLVIRDA